MRALTEMMCGVLVKIAHQEDLEGDSKAICEGLAYVAETVGERNALMLKSATALYQRASKGGA